MEEKGTLKVYNTNEDIREWGCFSLEIELVFVAGDLSGKRIIPIFSYAPEII